MPELTLIVASYNEADILQDKLENTLQLQYPSNRLRVIFVSDGSNDNSPEIIKRYSQVELFHSDERKGKSAAINRVMKHVTSPIVVFSDANTMLNSDAMELIARHYGDPKVGAVAGEKKIIENNSDDAVNAGEGIYWKYESTLKKWDYQLKTVVGAAGELFSVRTELFEEAPSDTIIEDFFLSMHIVERGFRVAYEPQACAVETGSASMGEEMKRKIRISAGGIQAIFRLGRMYNFFRYGIATFQFVSHRVLRWSLTPIALLIVLVTNILMYDRGILYQSLLLGQGLFYLAAIVGGILERRKIKFRLLFVPYYFLFMNYSVFLGFFRYMKGNQSVLWEKAKRAS